MKQLILVFATLALSGCSSRRSDPVRVTSADAASFAQRQVRYMTPLDLMQTLKQDFGPANPLYVPLECRELTDENRSLLGDSAAATGSPLFSEPGSSFVRWYYKCTGRYVQGLQVKAGSAPKDPDAELLFLGPSLKQYNDARPTLFSKFSTLDPKLQLAVVQEAIDRMIGPTEVVADFGYYKSSDDLAQKILSDVSVLDLSVIDTVAKILVEISLRDEFLSY